MTIPKNYALSGPYSPGSIEYPFNFPVNSESEVAVYAGAKRVYDIYTVELSSNGGAIRFNEAPSEPVTIVRDMEFSQELDFQNNTAFLPEVIEDGMDSIVMMIQQLKVDSDRSVKMPFGSEKKPEDLMEDLLSSVDSAKAAAAEAVQAVKEAGDVVDEAKETVKIIEDKAAEVYDSVSAVSQKVEGLSQSVESAKSEISTLRDEAITSINELSGSQRFTEIENSLGLVASNLTTLLAEFGAVSINYPDSITVSNAGSPEVNGEYAKTVDISGQIYYYRKAEVDGTTMAEFVLLLTRVNSKDTAGIWLNAIDTTGNWYVDKYYMSPYDISDPDNVEWTVEKGMLPTPVLTFNYKEQ